MRKFEYTIKDELGIHARPAGLLVKAVKALDSEVSITKGEKTVSCAKLMAVMGLGVKQGDTVTITVNGGDEAASEAAVKDFLTANL